MVAARFSNPEHEARPPTVFVVDDDPVVVQFIEDLVRSVRLDVRSFHSAEDFLAAFDPDWIGVLLVDVRMPGMSGLELQERLLARGIHLPTIVMTAYAEVSIAVQAMKAKALDFVEKPFSPQRLLDMIQHALKEDAERRRRLQTQSDIAGRLASLSPREREVLKLLVDGKSTKEIRQALGISLTTVDFHKRHVLEKMNASNVASLVRDMTSFSLCESPPWT